MIFALGLCVGVLGCSVFNRMANSYLHMKLKTLMAYTRDLEKEYTNLCIIHKYQKEAVKLLTNAYDFIYSDVYFTEEYRLWMKDKLKAQSEIDNLEKFMNQQQKEKK